MNIFETAKTNAENLLSAFNELTEDISFDRTFRVRVVRQNPDGRYIINYKNEEYSVKYNGVLQVNGMVWVCAPENNMSNLFVVNVNH